MRIRVLPVVLILLLPGCEEKLRPSVLPVNPATMPSQESWRSTVTFSDSARVKAVVWAGHISSYRNERITLLEDSVHVDFYNEFGEHTSLLTSRKGRVNDATEDFEATENVVVVSDSGTTLKTEKLIWTNADRKVRTDAFVDITSPTERIMGHGMVSDQALKHYTIFKVTGQAVTRE